MRTATTAVLSLLAVVNVCAQSQEEIAITVWGPLSGSVWLADAAPGARVAVNTWGCALPVEQMAVYPLGSSKSYPVAVVRDQGQSWSVQAVLPADLPYGPAELVADQEGCRIIGFLRVSPFAMIMRTDGLLVPDSKLTQPFVPGSLITLRTTGAGNVSPSEMTVQLGDRKFPLDGFQRSIAPGIDEISIVIPADFAGNGCYVPMRVLARGAASQTVWAPVSPDGKPCAHPFQLSNEQLAKLDAGGSLVTAAFSLTTVPELQFASWDRHYIASAAARGFDTETASCNILMPSAGYFAGSAFGNPSGFGPPSVSTGLTAVQLEGPSRRLTLWADEHQSRFLPSQEDWIPSLGFGRWTLTSEASPLLRPIQWEFVLGPEWKPTINTARLHERVIGWTWDGTQFRPGDRLSAYLETDWVKLGCSVNANAGSLEFLLPGSVSIPAQPATAFQTSYTLTSPRQVQPLVLATGEPGLGLVQGSVSGEYNSGSRGPK